MFGNVRRAQSVKAVLTSLKSHTELLYSDPRVYLVGYMYALFDIDRTLSACTMPVLPSSN